MNWNRISLFKLPNKTRDFNFHPRYYNERKEQLNKKIELYSDENKSEDRIRAIKFRESVQDNWGNSNHKTQMLRSNIRLLIILGLILALFYYLFIGLDNVGDLIENVKK